VTVRERFPACWLLIVILSNIFFILMPFAAETESFAIRFLSHGGEHDSGRFVVFRPGFELDGIGLLKIAHHFQVIALTGEDFVVGIP